MLQTNLLPKEEAKIISMEQWLRVIRFTGIGTSAALVIGITFLAPAFLPLYFQSKELQRSFAIQTESIKKIDIEQITKTATRIKTIADSLSHASQQRNPASLIFDTLSPDKTGILITALSADKNGSILIAGKAATRLNLLDFEEHLRDSGFFQDIAAPLANIIRETDIDFTFRGKLKSSYSL